MRILSFCIAIMILVMSCIPCSDAGCMTMPIVKTAHATEPDSHKEATGKEHKDLCSPFCQCTCCAVTCALPVLPGMSIDALSLCPGRVFTAYMQHRPEGVNLPVWQPPQLG